MRLEFVFCGEASYLIYQRLIKPALSRLNLPTFLKFSDYQVAASDYQKFARLASHPWNSELSQYQTDEDKLE